MPNGAECQTARNSEERKRRRNRKARGATDRLQGWDPAAL